MVDKPVIFWCGSILNFAGLQIFKGEAPSATQWSRGLIYGLQKNGIDVITFSPIWDSLFPRGKLFPTNKEFLDSTINQQSVHYFNLPIIRTYSVAYSLERKISKLLNEGIKPLAILNYNPYPHYTIALKKISQKYPNINWINIILDLDNPEIDGWESFSINTYGSKGSVFLSWWGYKNAPTQNKLHLDAGWDGILPQNRINTFEKKIIYAGKLSDLGGINVIINAIKLFPEKNISFEFYGKGYHQDLEQLSKNDSRVKIKGFVPDDELDKACSEAFAFLSPRDSSSHETKMIFPSKILFYLKYKKPIISEILPGLSPDYKDLLICPIDNTPFAWANSINYTINLSEPDLIRLTAKISIFLEKKLWQNQAKNLINFINNINN